MAVRNLVGFVYNSQIPEAAGLVDTLVKSLSLGEGCWVSSAAQIGDVRDRLDSTSLTVVVGGDGTIISAVRVTAPFSVPIVGINMGRVGFMTELSVDEAVEKLPMYLSGGLRVEERMMLHASVVSNSKEAPRLSQHALNDVVVGRGVVARLLDIDTTVDGVPLTSYRADSVIVSTATGSTGYALSAGGPILHPEASLMLLQPVAAHTGLRDGLILPENSVIELKARSGHQAMLSVDGFLDTDISTDDKVTITRSPHVARFLRAHPPSTFYAALTRRLGLVYRLEQPEASP